MLELFGKLETGETVQKATISAHGLTASILTYGATLQDLRLTAFSHPLVLGFNSLEAYLQHSEYFGANVGRVANRLANGRATIDNKIWQLDRNENGTHMLHGGSEGCANRIWQITDYGEDFVKLSILLPDGHMGFPGNLEISLTYRIIHSEQSGPGLCLDYQARTDRPTICNLAHHSYFNLDGSKTIEGHQLQIHADHYLPVDDNQIPTGEVAPVFSTDFNFRTMRTISAGKEKQPLDHNFCVSDRQMEPRPVASLKGNNNLTLTVSTTEPGLQVYDGGGINCRTPGLTGSIYPEHAGIALEAQGWPDAPNHPQFPDIELNPDEIYRQITIFSFR